MADAKASPKTSARRRESSVIRINNRARAKLDHLIETHHRTGGPGQNYSWAISEALNMTTSRDIRGFLLDTGTDLLRRIYPKNEDWNVICNHLKVVGLQPHLREQARLALTLAVAPAPITGLEGDEMTLEEEVREAISRIDIDIID